MLYEPIRDNPSEPSIDVPRAAAAAGSHARHIDSRRTGPGWYMGLRLASPGQRYIRGFLTYGPSILISLFGLMANSTAATAFCSIVSWVYLLGFTFQTAKRNNLGGALTKTRLVSVKTGPNGEVLVTYPSTGQLAIRMVLFLTLDVPLGWLKILLSPRSRSIGDTLADTIVIAEGQVVPEPAVTYARP